jgi:hypothetical protein
MIEADRLVAGTRVRLVEPSHALDVPVPTGYIVGPDEWTDYYIVHLDAPARYRHADGHVEELSEIREDRDNMELLDHPDA